MSWKEKDDQLVKVFTLDSFSDLINRLPELAEVADAMDHHPDFEVFAYRNIKFKLMTHSEGTITNKDYELADEIDRIFEES